VLKGLAPEKLVRTGFAVNSPALQQIKIIRPRSSVATAMVNRKHQ
jgi:hypothetical protein